MRASNYPICWRWAFGWKRWRYFFRLVFPFLRPVKFIPGYDVLTVVGPPWWHWPLIVVRNFNYAIRGPV